MKTFLLMVGLAVNIPFQSWQHKQSHNCENQKFEDLQTEIQHSYLRGVAENSPVIRILQPIYVKSNIVDDPITNSDRKNIITKEDLFSLLQKENYRLNLFQQRILIPTVTVLQQNYINSNFKMLRTHFAAEY